MQFLYNILNLLKYNPKDPLLFNSGFFLVFFLLFLIVYQLAKNHDAWRIRIIILFSFYFFYKACGWYTIFMLLVGITDFSLSNIISKSISKSDKKKWLIVSIVINLGLLFYFKYTNFFIELLNAWELGHIKPIHVLLPVGISFYTFENLSYTVDVYRGTITPVKKLSTYLAFLSFFPKLMMGPIIRAADFLPQLQAKPTVTHKQVHEGMYLIASGIFKKMIIADFLYSNYVERIFDNPSLYSGFECLIAVYGYAFVIYGDFSGYSSIALGIAKWMGIELNINFDSPYQSTSITTFWRRWHISLSSWLKDYLYIPLGGNRVPKWRQSINLFTTMLIGGVWHGASYNFIIWGGMHGAALGVDKSKNRIVERFSKIKNHINNNKKVYKCISLLFTFHFVCLCWIYFKAENFHQAHQMISRIILHFNTAVIIDWLHHYYKIAFILSIGALLHFIPTTWEQKQLHRTMHKSIISRTTIFISIILLAAFCKSATPILPVYLQF